MLDLFQRRNKQRSTFQRYGDQYNRVTLHRRAQEALCEARKEADRYTTMARAAMQRAEEANRSKTEFLANMSHELRTPLNAIIGFSEIIENEILGKADSNPKYVGYARDINSAGEHLLNVINDILDIAKIEVGRLELDEEAFDLDGYRRLEEIGVTGVMTMPWLLYGGDPSLLEDKKDGLKRFAAEIIGKMR